MNTDLYLGQWDMSDLSTYTIQCNCCSNNVNVFGPVKEGEGKSQNIGRYYYSCLTNGCNFFRWFEFKWPKVCDKVLNENKINKELDEITDIFKSVSIEMIDEKNKLLLILKLNDIINKLKQSNKISKTKCNQYLTLTNNFLKLIS